MKVKEQLQHWKNFIKDIVWILRIVWKKHYILLSTSLVVSVCIALISLFQAYANSVLVNTVVSSTAHTAGNKAVVFSLVLIGLSLIIPSFLYLFQGYFEKEIYFMLSKHFDLLIEEKRIELDISQYENSEFNNFVNRVNEKGVYVISNIVSSLFANFQSLITIIFASVIIAHQSKIIFLAIFIASIPGLIIGTAYGNLGWYVWGDDINAEERRKYWSIKGYIKSIPSLTEIKLFDLGRKFIEKIRTFLESIEKKKRKNEKKYLIRQLAASLLTQGVLLGAIIFFVHQAISGQILVGTIIFLFGSMVGFQYSINSLFSDIGKQQEDRLYIHDLSTFLKTGSEVLDGNQELALESSPEIRFENISFSYQGSGNNIYESLSLTISPGEKLAIVGLNGAGKTTLIKLLCRFYDPTKGAIFINGIDLRSIKKNSWYKNIGVLFQDFAKFGFPTVGELVSFGDITKKYNKQEVVNAIDMSDAHFVKQWENTYDQQLSKEFKDGMEPSGGQWQKLAIARLFYRNSKVWILDEPTSAIDADAESKIFESLARLPKDKTVILISHRFSTVRTADRIIVIDEGKVRESGNHQELMTLDGEYARLFNLQAQGYK